MRQQGTKEQPAKLPTDAAKQAVVVPTHVEDERFANLIGAGIELPHIVQATAFRRRHNGQPPRHRRDGTRVILRRLEYVVAAGDLHDFDYRILLSLASPTVSQAN